MNITNERDVLVVSHILLLIKELVFGDLLLKLAWSVIPELSKHALGTIELRYCLQMNLIFNHDKKAERAI